MKELHQLYFSSYTACYGSEMEGEMGEKFSKLTCERYQKYIYNFDVCVSVHH